MSDARPDSVSAIPAPHGQLEAIYRPRRNDAEAIALLLHPHPLYGGTMHNKVVFHSAKALEEAGYETLRINFRGVGSSSGRHDDGRGETEDAMVALEFLRAAQPAVSRCLVLGFSFGAAIAFVLDARSDDVDQVIAIGTPVYALSAPGAANTARHTTFIHGDRDEVASLAPLQTALDAIDGHGEIVVIPGADHFFSGHLKELREAVRRAVG